MIPANRTRRGFSLVEMVVVIGILVLLSGLLIVVGQSVVNQARVQETQRALQLLDMSVQEYQLTADRSLTWWDQNDGTDPQMFDLHSSTPEVLIITEMLEVIRQPESVAKIIGQIDPDLVYRYQAGTYPEWIATTTERSEVDGRFDGGIVILDAWGKPIYTTHPGRPWYHTDFLSKDDDGTIRTYNELKYGVSRHKRVCFVSSGPDGEFGWLNVPPSSVFFQRTQDNLYSYDPGSPRD